MKTATSFEMTIVDLFRFSDGRTVFVGRIDGEAKFIRPCRCELRVDGVLRSVIQLEGEMMPDRNSPEGYRSVSTRDSVSLDRQLLSTSKCHLKSVFQYESEFQPSLACGREKVSGTYSERNKAD